MTDVAYLAPTRKLFRYYQTLGSKALAQLPDAHINRQPTPESNSPAVIVRHIAGNMRSRFTDFLTSDGEKPWRDRDAEFVFVYPDKAALLADWDSGWQCFFAAVDPLTDAQLGQIVFIRNEGHTVFEALQRQLAHYAYHVGQLVYLCRMLVGEEGWESLSIPKGDSKSFNAEKFSAEQSKIFFVDKLSVGR